MAIMTVGDNVLITFNGFLSGQRIMSTFGYVLTVVTGAPDQNDFLNDVFDELESPAGLIEKYNACVPQNYTGSEVWLQVIRPTRYAKKVKPWPGFPTNWPVDGVTANLAGVIERRGELARRDNISTLHVPISGDPTAVVDGILTTAMKNALDALAVEMVNAILIPASAANLTPSILNGPLAANVTPISHAFPQSTARVMRRRTVGLGI